MRIFLAGDFHRSTHWALGMISQAQRENCKIILQLGDFAAWGSQRETFLDVLENRLDQYGITMYWVDGNHEDHLKIADERGDQHGFVFTRPHIVHLERGHVWQWGTKRFLAMGGAYSIDKGSRTEYVSWWPQETITMTDALRASENLDGTTVDIMVTHDVPWGVQRPYGPYTGGGNKDLWPESTANRKLLRSIMEEARPKLLVHGHVHNRYTEQLVLDDGDTEVEVHGFGCNDMGHAAWAVLDIS